MASHQTNPAEARSCVLLLSLDKQPWFDEMYNRLLCTLSDRARLVRASSSNAALEFLKNDNPDAIFVTDAEITAKHYRITIKRISEYVFDGGKVIFGGTFSGFVKPMEMGAFFKNNFGLRWESGAYHRTTLRLNQDALGNLPSSSLLVNEYSQKALNAKNVEKTNAIYLPSDPEEAETLEYGRSPGGLYQTPAAWAKVGHGWVGYIGDVNQEEGTDAVVLTMCGL